MPTDSPQGLKTSRRHRFRLAWLLPPVIASVVAITSLALAFISSREVRRLTVDAAGERLRTPIAELAENLAAGPVQRLAEVTETAAMPALHELLRGNESARSAALRELQLLQGQTSRRDGIELFASDGRVVLSVESPVDSLVVPKVLRRQPRSYNSDAPRAWISEIQLSDSVQWLDMTASVPGDAQPLGYLVRRHRLRPASEQAIELISNLIGPQVQLAVGHPATGWSDLQGGQRGPSVSVFAPDTAIRSEGSGAKAAIGRATIIPGTPWYLWVELPVDVALAGTRSFLRDLAIGGLLVVLAGGVLGTLLSRLLSRPLEELTEAAQSVAGGDYQRRVTANGPGEIGKLGLAFNAMAEQIDEGRRNLESRVAERTMMLEGSVQQLSESEERFRQLASSTPDAIIISDGDGNIAYINPSGERMFGYPPGALAGRSVSQLMPDTHRRAHAAGHSRYTHTGVSRIMGQVHEMPALRSDGTQFPAELTLTGWTQGGERTVAAIMRDVTARQQLSDSLERHARDLEEANAELAAFSYSVSHDLRAPLRSIHGFTQALVEDHSHALNEEGLDYARRVNAAAQRMSRLIDDLLELSRVSRTNLSRRPVDLVPLAVACVEELRRRDPERSCELVCPPRLEVSGDERLLRQVMQNLLENAWKFTSTRSAARIELSEALTVHGATITVRDNGVGFDPRYANKLFGVFQRLHSERDFPGTGVGLAIVQRIVQRHGGTVWGDSAPEAGAAFHFTLETESAER